MSNNNNSNKTGITLLNETKSTTEQGQSKNGFKVILTKTGEMSKRAIVSAQSKARELSEQRSAKNYETQVKKYNPLFESECRRENFRLPNVIVIVEAHERENIEVCKNAIAYRTIEKDVEILHLFDDKLTSCPIEFIPNASCGSVYLVHPHDSHKYIDTDRYFSVTHEEKLAELQHIAYALGASKFNVEMIESEQTLRSGEIRAGANFKAKREDGGQTDIVNVDASFSSENAMNRASKSVAEAVFSGKRNPKRPTLCWYTHDRNVCNLVDMRCSVSSMVGIATYSIQLDSSMSASISRNAARKVDIAVAQMGLSCDLSIKSEKEFSRKLIFKVDF